ncbi:MAG: flagellar motor switch protein FliG [Limnochordales bacterium]|nr:flagellar motor switch protein FliG [Limnochordales bacterium]
MADSRTSYARTALGNTPRRKAAILLLSLGPEISRQVLQRLPEEEMEQLGREIAVLGEVSPEEILQVLQEFLELYEIRSRILEGGLSSVQRLIEQAFGPERAAALLQRVTGAAGSRPFAFMWQADPEQLAGYFQHEHPQTIALVLAYLVPDQAAAVLAALPAELQAEVVMRLASLDRTSPEVLAEVEDALRLRFREVETPDFQVAGGVEAAAAILNRVDGSTEKSIMDALERTDPALAEEIKRRLFVFDDLVNLDDRSIQRVIREVDLKDLALALKGASETVKAAIFRNMSQRAAAMVKEEIEYMGPVRLRDVENAQAQVVAVVRRLEEAGEIIVSTGRGDEIVV